MNLLSPLEAPARLAARVVDELLAAQQVTAGLEVMRELRRLVRNGLGSLERLEAQADRVIELGERIDARAESIVALGERLDSRAEAILAFGVGFEQLGREIKTEASLVHARAEEVVRQADEVKPMLERAIGLVEPLQGTVDRLGRVVDRFPGGRAGTRSRRS